MGVCDRLEIKGLGSNGLVSTGLRNGSGNETRMRC